MTICVLLDAKNSSRDHQSKHTNISSIWKFVSYILNFTYMQSIYIHTHNNIYTQFLHQKHLLQKKTEIIHPSNFLESVATRWGRFDHPTFATVDSFIFGRSSSNSMVPSSATFDRERSCRCPKNRYTFMVVLFVKGRVLILGGVFLLSCSWFLWSCVDLGRFFFLVVNCFWDDWMDVW